MCFELQKLRRRLGVPDTGASTQPHNDTEDTGCGQQCLAGSKLLSCAVAAAAIAKRSLLCTDALRSNLTHELGGDVPI